MDTLLEMIFGSSVSNHRCRYLITLRSSGMHYAFLIITDRVRTCLLIRSFDAVCSKLCLILLRIRNPTHSVCGNTA